MENFLEIPIENLLGRLNYFSRGAPALLTGGVNNDVASSWGVGDKCLARWSRDGVWYNAEILQVTKEGFYVRFSDYENEDEVEKGDIVGSGGIIPEDGLLDAGVFLPWQAGDKCIACWQDDSVYSVWYNAKVLEVGSDCFHVLFIDYETTDLVKKEDIVGSVEDVPEGDDIDDCVFDRVDQWIPGIRTPIMMAIAELQHHWGHHGFVWPYGHQGVVQVGDYHNGRKIVSVGLGEHSGVCNLFISNNDTGELNTIAITRVRTPGKVSFIFEAEGETLFDEEWVVKLHEYYGTMSNDSLDSFVLIILKCVLPWVGELIQ